MVGAYADEALSEAHSSHFVTLWFAGIAITTGTSLDNIAGNVTLAAISTRIGFVTPIQAWPKRGVSVWRADCHDDCGRCQNSEVREETHLC